MADKVRVGFIGTGGIAGQHINALAKMDDVQFVAFCDVVSEKAEKAAQEHGAKAFTSADALYDAVKPDAVWVCLPPFAHRDTELAAAERGIPFIVEKPVTIDLAQAAQVVKAVESKGLITAAAYMNRYRKGIQEAKKRFVDDPPALAFGGWIGGGPPTEGTTHWFFDKKRSGGQLLEQTTHTVDLVRYFCGEAVEVCAYGTREFNKGVPGYDTEDASIATVRFANGAIATLMSALASNASGGVFLTVHAKNTTAKLDGWNHDLTLLSVGADPVQIAGEGNILEIEDRAFVDAVKSGDPSGIMSSYADGVKSAQISILANECMEQGGARRV